VGKRRQRKWKGTKQKVDGQRKENPENKYKGEHKREDTKGRAQAKKNNEDGKIIQMGMSRAKTRKEERKRLQRE
jgi:hypothetical protein